ncbi:hypothetical protein C1M56_15870 [Vibrio diazotrophicus]|nr:hypothetical protein C1M56_15870 [Vibrio diazotrophicus]
MRVVNTNLKEYDDLVDKYSGVLLSELTEEFGDEQTALYVTVLTFETLWLFLKSNAPPHNILRWLHIRAKYIQSAKVNSH